MNSLHRDLLDVVKAHAPDLATYHPEGLDDATLRVPVGVTKERNGIQLLDWRKMDKRHLPTPVFGEPLTKKQALGLGIMLIKASQDVGWG